MGKMNLRWCSLLVCVVLLAVNTGAQEETETPTPEAGPQILTVWWPDELLPLADTELEALVAAQTESFLANRTNVDVITRRRLVGATGGILSTMRAGSTVAPDALPDLTLLRRQDLIAAQQQDLLQSMEGRVASAITGDLDSALALGQLSGELYGLPYVLELNHLVYRRQAGQRVTDWAFEDVLARGETFTFPGSAQNRLNNTVLLQYLAAGADLNPDETLRFDEEAVRAVLEFYEQASDDQIVSGFALNYATPSAYLGMLLDESLDAGVVTSSLYLEQFAADSSFAIAPIPTPDGSLSAALDGWIWVLTTDDPETQALGLEYASWMLSAQQLGEFTQMAQRLPALRTVLAEMDLPTTTIASYQSLLDRAVLLPISSASGAVASAIQDALVSVLSSQMTAEDALARIIEQLGE